MDQTKIDLETIGSTGAHSDKKLLDELRKRKLVEKKYALATRLVPRRGQASEC